jgi:hypothetical protein
VYGHNLSPQAPVKVPPFMPPMFGYEKLANFEVYSYPAAGTYLMTLVGLLLAAALFRAWWSDWREHSAELLHADAHA